MSRISRLDRTQVTPEIAAALRQSLCPARQRAQHVPRHGPSARDLRHHAGALWRGAQYRHGLHQAQGTDHRPHQPGQRHALLPGQPHHSRPRSGLDRRPARPSRRLASRAKTLPPPKKPPFAWPRPSPATPTPSATSNSPSCAASTPKAKSSSCSAPSASSTTSTASTTPSKCSPPNPAKAAARRTRQNSCRDPEAFPLSRTHSEMAGHRDRDSFAHANNKGAH